MQSNQNQQMFLDRIKRGRIELLFLSENNPCLAPLILTAGLPCEAPEKENGACLNLPAGRYLLGRS